MTQLDVYKRQIETRFEELGGQLTAEEEAQADSYASQLMEQYGDTYKANGIGLNLSLIHISMCIRDRPDTSCQRKQQRSTHQRP